MKKYLFLLAIIGLLVACNRDNNPGSGGRNAPLAVTVGANHVSPVSVVLTGKANLGSTVASDLIVGFQYSKSSGILPSNSKAVEATDADASYNYTSGITGLEPKTTYYYRSFVRQNGQDTYGDTKEFTTLDIGSLLETRDATDINATSAKLNAKLDLTDVISKSITYGFYWGTSETSLNTKISGGIISDNTFSSLLNNLSHKTQYWYKAYVKLDGLTLYSDTKTLTTDLINVESVSLDNSEYTFNTIGNTVMLKATVSPSDATDKSVEWTSDNENVAAVDSNGKVTAIGNGTASITVTTKDQSKTATCIITVDQLVTGITLNKTAITLNEGQEQTLTAVVAPNNANDKTLNWTSSNTSIATVDVNGKVIAVSKGSAIITAAANDGSGISASCSITVNRLVTSIQLDKTSLYIYNGKTATIIATVLPSSASNTSVSWASSNTSVATVSSSGVVTGVTRGNTIITASAKDGSGVKATCEVEVKQFVTGISLDRTTVFLNEGQEQSLMATVAPNNANDKTISWTSSDTSIATVDANGKVIALSRGRATISAIANDGSGISASCSVIISPIGAVDLGLNMSDGRIIYWATCNLCEDGFVSSPEQYGDYYAWGEIQPHYVKGHSLDNPCSDWRIINGKTMNGYDFHTYKWCNGSYTTLTRYNFNRSDGSVDNKSDFKDYAYADDAARQTLGGSWRTPTDAEWTILRTKCSWTFTTQDGINGMLVTGPNGCSIFLPAAGRRVQTNLKDLNTYGDYWSSSVVTDQHAVAWSVRFASNSITRYYDIRCEGLSVRPVTD